ncbi:MAG: sensor histidine kinase [Chitinophagaceae bacterium]|nr:sensor histidine kinase [Chitinophagaceae bacterium]
MLKSALIIFGCLLGTISPGQDLSQIFSKNEIEKQQQQIKTVIAEYEQPLLNEVQKQCTKKEHEGIFDTLLKMSYYPLAINYNSFLFSKYSVLTLLLRKNMIYYYKKQYDSSLHYLQLALQLALQYKFVYDDLHQIRPAINNLYFLSGNLAGVLKTSTEGLITAEKNKDKKQAAHFTNVIGHVHLKYKNFKEATSYFESYNTQTQAMANKLFMAHAQLNLAELFMAQNDADKSIYHLNLSKNLYTQLTQEGKINKATLSTRTLHINYKIAEALLLKKDCNNALTYIVSDAALDTIQNVNGYDLASYYIIAGSVYNCLNQPVDAIKHLRNGLQKSMLEKHAEYTRDALEQIAIAYSKLQQFDSAWKYNELYKQMRNSIENSRNENDLFQKEAVMRLELEQQKYNAALAKQKMFRNILGVLLICIFLFALLLYNRYRLKQKNILQQQENKQQQELLATALSVQDQERKRIAQDLHDGLGSLLSAVKLKISDLPVPQQPYELEKIEASIHLLDEAMLEMKNISYDMMPATLSKLGLTAALQNLFNRISSKNKLQIQYHHFGFKERLDEQTELNIYRIVLECINNTVKHAGAANAAVQLIKHDDYINIVIEDDGKGFDTAHPSLTGNGLHNIFTRVQNRKGSIDIDSKPGNGTSIIIDIPYS